MKMPQSLNSNSANYSLHCGVRNFTKVTKTETILISYNQNNLFYPFLITIKSVRKDNSGQDIIHTTNTVDNPHPPGHFRTYRTPSTQHLLQLLILLWAEQRAAGPLRFKFRSTAHDLLVDLPVSIEFMCTAFEKVSSLHCQNTKLFSQGSFSSLFCEHTSSTQSRKRANRTSLTPTFLPSLRPRVRMSVLLPFLSRCSALLLSSRCEYTAFYGHTDAYILVVFFKKKIKHKT